MIINKMNVMNVRHIDVTEKLIIMQTIIDSKKPLIVISKLQVFNIFDVLNVLNLLINSIFDYI